MSDSAPHLPARPSLEQLRKQAKELLRQYRAGEQTEEALNAFADRVTLEIAERRLS